MLRLFMMLIALSLASSIVAGPTHNSKIKRVIYITFDGTRWQDVVQDKVYFPKWWSKYASLGKFYGMPNAKDKIEVASIAISLPSYQSQMSGQVQPCDGNACGRITVETMPELLLQQKNFTAKDVAIFSSWWKIAYAVEHIAGKVYANTGNMPVVDPFTQQADSVMGELNSKQANDLPDEKADRWDGYTIAQAMHYLDKYEPKFLWIALTDADDAAHAGSLLAYHHALTVFDNFIDQFFTYLINSNKLADTLVIVTTDHGRGNGDNWTSHGPAYPESKRTWAFVVNGELIPDQQNEQEYYTTRSMRPTMEKVFIKQ